MCCVVPLYGREVVLLMYKVILDAKGQTVVYVLSSFASCVIEKRDKAMKVNSIPSMLNAVKGCRKGQIATNRKKDDAMKVAINAAGIDGPELKSNVV